MSFDFMVMKFTGFDWDEGNIEKCQKHGVSIAEIEAAFESEDLHVAPDLIHSHAEQRFRAVSRTPAGRTMFLVFTFRNYEARFLLRVISARFMHKKEIDEYEKDISQL
jgi:uncharacterized protein